MGYEQQRDQMQAQSFNLEQVYAWHRFRAKQSLI